MRNLLGWTFIVFFLFIFWPFAILLLIIWPWGSSDD